MSTHEIFAEAVKSGAAVEVLTLLRDMLSEERRVLAYREFVTAKAAFKAKVQPIIKDRSNPQYNSKYASIGSIVGGTVELLAAHGFDVSWEVSTDDGMVSVRCVLAHTGGHRALVTMSSPPDETGKKFPLHAMKSAVTYLRAATYEAVVGLAASDESDDDGNAASGIQVQGGGTITAAQAAELQELIERGGIDSRAFLSWLEVGELRQIPVSRFTSAKQALERKVNAANHN